MIIDREDDIASIAGESVAEGDAAAEEVDRWYAAKPRSQQL